jgi:hypothetical protein
MSSEAGSGLQRRTRKRQLSSKEAEAGAGRQEQLTFSDALFERACSSLGAQASRLHIAT